jgi:NADH:ubiquinone oxidoreductase subunit 6 (subunit J)
MGLFIKIIIVVLFIGLVISLTSSLIFILKDVESQRKRGLYALGIRLGLASILMFTIFFGLSSGYLGSNAPWDKKMSREQIQEIQQQ